MAPSQMAAITAVEAFGKAMPSSRTTAPTMVHFSFVRSDMLRWEAPQNAGHFTILLCYGRIHV